MANTPDKTNDKTQVESKTAAKVEEKTEGLSSESLDGVLFQMDVQNAGAPIEERLPEGSGADTSGRTQDLAKALAAGPVTFD